MLAIEKEQRPRPATATRAPFGALADGRHVEAITLDNGRGIRATVISYGAALQALVTPGRDGTLRDIALGFDVLTDYVAHPYYFGATIGRCANRIAGARFSLDGEQHMLGRNDGPNTLHGGHDGFHRQLWEVTSVSDGTEACVTLALTSPDGDQGYPGTLRVTTTYTLDTLDQLQIDYRATTDEPTVVNITSHSAFNLAGEASGQSIEDHVLTIPAACFTAVDANLIPTGEYRPVAGTPFDFHKARPIGEGLHDEQDDQIRIGHGYDQNFVVSAASVPELQLMARLEHPVSGRVLELLSNQPGVQLYSGNSFDGRSIGKGGGAYRKHAGIALEPQLFPNTPNMPAFGSARLDPGQTYRSTLLYRLSTTTY